LLVANTDQQVARHAAQIEAQGVLQIAAFTSSLILLLSSSAGSAHRQLFAVVCCRCSSGRLRPSTGLVNRGPIAARASAFPRHAPPVAPPVLKSSKRPVMLNGRSWLVMPGLRLASARAPVAQHASP
jgi:hypothetical protein